MSLAFGGEVNTKMSEMPEMPEIRVEEVLKLIAPQEILTLGRNKF